MSSSRDSIKDIWGKRSPYFGTWSERVDERTSDVADSWVQSACVLCSNGCGLEIGVKDGRIVGVRGRADDHVNRGRLGPKGLHGWEANNSSDRLTTPLIRKQGKLEPASWDEAMRLMSKNPKLSSRNTRRVRSGFIRQVSCFLKNITRWQSLGKRVWERRTWMVIRVCAPLPRVRL